MIFFWFLQQQKTYIFSIIFREETRNLRTRRRNLLWWLLAFTLLSRRIRRSDRVILWQENTQVRQGSYHRRRIRRWDRGHTMAGEYAGETGVIPWQENTQVRQGHGKTSAAWLLSIIWYFLARKIGLISLNSFDAGSKIYIFIWMLATASFFIFLHFVLFKEPQV